MTALGAIALLISLTGLVLRRPALIAVAMGIGAGVPYSAGTTIGQTVPVFTLVTLVAVLAVGIGDRPVRSAGYTLLVAFAAWAVVVTLVGPWAFAGIPTVSPRDVIENQLGAPTPLTYAISNLAQVTYLVTALLGVLFLVRSGTALVALMTAAWTGVGASLVRSALKVVGFDGLGPVFDTMDVAYSGPWDSRWRGVFAEPSELAAFSLATLALALTATFTARTGRTRAASGWLAVVAAVDLVGSASGTAVVGSAVVAGLALVTLVVRYVSAGGRGTPWLVLGTLTGIAVALTVGAELLAPALDVYHGKIGSQSQEARSGADAMGLEVLRNTVGLGAGLGSNRTSSFAVLLLSTTGVVGVALFGAGMVVTLTGALRVPAARPVAAGLLALLVAKSVATPDLSTPLLWMLVAACLAAAVPAVDSGDVVSAPALPAGRRLGSAGRRVDPAGRRLGPAIGRITRPARQGPGR